MTADLRDQLADFEAAARRLTRPGDPIRISPAADLGQLLRDLRHQAGLSQNQLARLTYVTKSGVAAREQRPGLSAGALLEHVDALGYDVALIPRRTA